MISALFTSATPEFINDIFVCSQRLSVYFKVLLETIYVYGRKIEKGLALFLSQNTKRQHGSFYKK